MTYKIGDSVWCLADPGHPVAPSGGWVAAVVVGPSPLAVRERYWELDIDGGEWHSPESRLRPRDPPARKDLKPVTWASCPWQPKVTA